MEILKFAKEPISLETPIGEEEDSRLGDFIEDTNMSAPIDSTIDTSLKEITNEAKEINYSRSNYVSLILEGRKYIMEEVFKDRFETIRKMPGGVPPRK